MTAAIHLVSSPGEAHVAVVRNRRLIDYALWRPGAPDGVGDIHRGRVVSVVPSMAGAFVALADAEGFLPDSDGAKGLTVGAIITVQVARAAQGGKGPRLSMRGLNRPATRGPATQGPVTEGPVTQGPVTQGPAALLKRGPSPVEILATRHADAVVLADDAGVAAELRPVLGERVSVTHESLDDDIAEAIDSLSRNCVDLPGGVRVSIWPTPALVAIDVDGASALARAGHAALNRTALPWLGDQIRLRNLSGAIVVDVAGLSARKRVALGPDLTAALANDPLRPKFLGFTALGLMEIVRSRVHPPLHELLGSSLAAGLAGLRALLVAFHQDRRLPALRAHPAIVTALQADTAALPDVLRRTGHTAALRSDPSLPEGIWMLEKDDG